MPTLDLPIDATLIKALELPTISDMRLPRPEVPMLHLPIGGTLTAVADPTKGVPSDCSMSVNLLLQLAPVMVSMQPIFQVLTLANALKGFFEAFPDITKAGTAATNVLPALADVIKLFEQMTGVGAAMLFVKDLLNMLGNLLRGLGQSLRAAARALHGLAAPIEGARRIGNTEVVEALECAQENAIRSAQSSLLVLEPLKPLLNLTQPFFDKASIPMITLPTLNNPNDSNSIESAGQMLIAFGEECLKIARRIIV